MEFEFADKDSKNILFLAKDWKVTIGVREMEKI